MGTTAVAVSVQLLRAHCGPAEDDLQRAIVSFLRSLPLDVVLAAPAIIDGAGVVRVTITGPAVPDAPFCEIVVTRRSGLPNAVELIAAEAPGDR